MAARMMLGIAVACLLAAVAQAQTPSPPQRTISVTGVAEQMVLPDTATIVLAVETQDKTVSAAVTANNQKTQAVLNAITGLNITGLTTRTLGFDVEPVYQQPPRGSTAPPAITGYRVVNQVEVKVTQPQPGALSTTVGQILDTALAAGANRVDSLQFSIVDEETVRRSLMAEATRNAHDTAMVLAAAANMELGPPVTISTTPIYTPTPMYARTAEAAGGVPIQVGPMQVQATVQVVYEMRAP